jgi:predicted ester cyclase
MSKRMAMVAVLLCAAAGCKKKSPSDNAGTMGSGSAGSAGSGAGSAGTAGSAGSADQVEPPEPAAKTPEELAARYQECWGFWNDGKLDDFKTCYASDATGEEPGTGMPPAQGADAVVAQTQMFKKAFPDAKGELQLVMVSGHTVIGIALITGTQTAPMETPMGAIPASKKKVGFYLGQVAELNDQGQLTKETDYDDLATVMAQIGASKMPARKAIDKGWPEKVVVIAKDDDAEKANLTAFQAMTDAFNKHDVKALGAALTDDSTWSEAASPKDETKKQVLGEMPQMWKGFSDLKFDVTTSWAAGDYVAALESFDGTNDGAVKMMKLKKTGKKVEAPFLAVHRIKDGKVAATWIFYQSMDLARQLGMMPPPKPPGGAAAPK